MQKEKHSEGYREVHSLFRTERFRYELQDLLDGRFKLLVIEPNQELRGLVVGDFSEQLGTWGGDNFCADSTTKKSPNALLKQLFGKEKYVSHFDVVYIGSSVNMELADEIAKRIDEGSLDVKVIRLSDLEGICGNIPIHQKRLARIYTSDEALEQLQKVTDRMGCGEEDAILESLHINSLLSRIFSPEFKPTTAIARGEGAAPGAASAPSFSNFEEAKRYIGADPNHRIIFVTYQLTPQHTEILRQISGLITREKVTEGTHSKMLITSYGIPCISDCEVRLQESCVYFGTTQVRDGTYLGMDGSLGEVYMGDFPIVDSPIIQDAKRARGQKRYKPSQSTIVYSEFLGQVSRILEQDKGMGIYAFAATADEARLARTLATNGGKSMVKGVGIVKTENHFTGEEEKACLSDLLLSEETHVREEAKKRLLGREQGLFYELMLEMKGMPVQIRLLDSLGELFPKGPLHSDNQFDLRGPDIALKYPELYDVQIEAILKSAYDLKGKNIEPRIIIPFVRSEREVIKIREMIASVYARIGIEKKDLNIPLGVMIENPAAIGKIREFYNQGARSFVFGTNDLTSTGLCIARGRAEMALLRAQAGIYYKDPFVYLEDPIKRQMEASVKIIKGLGTGVSFGVTGRHTSVPQNILFFDHIGMDYVAVPPYEIPETLHNVARAAYIRVAYITPRG